MKRLISVLVFLALVFTSTLAWAPPGGGDVRVRDRNSTNRADVESMATTISNTLFGLVGLNVQYFHDGTQPRVVVGSQVNSDAVAQTTYMPYQASFLHYLNGSQWARWQGTTLADGLTYPTAPFIIAVMGVDNGATIDPAKSGAVQEILVRDVETKPGADAGNDREKGAKVYSQPYNPAKETTTGVGTAAQTVLAAKEVLSWAKCCVYLQNDDGADPFTDMDVDISPDSASWLAINDTSCDNLAAGGMCVFCWTDPYRYVRVQVAAADANQVDVDAWITCNQN
jgi:hypothetical protein